MAGFDLAEFSRATAALAKTAEPLTLAIHGGPRRGGSAFHWRDGLFVAAEEVVEGDDEIDVVLADGNAAKAAIQGRDPSTGIVLIRPGQETPDQEFERAATPQAGALAMIVGRVEATPIASLGTVSACGPAWRSMRGGQIDRRITLAAPLDGRFVGGAVLDAEGRLIGMMLFGPRRRAIVIPASTIDRVAPILAEKGYMARGFLGAGLHPVRGSDVAGAMVMSLEKNGPAEQAGLRLGDIVTGWDGETISGPREVIRRLGSDSVGTTAKLSVSRGGEAREVAVRIGTRPLA